MPYRFKRVEPVAPRGRGNAYWTLISIGIGLIGALFIVMLS